LGRYRVAVQIIETLPALRVLAGALRAALQFDGSFVRHSVYLAVRQRKCREGGKDIFVHASALEAAGIRTLNEGDRVSFVLEDDKAVGTGSELKKI